MFVELMPLLAGRTVLITVAREDEKMVRVNFIPSRLLKNGQKKGIAIGRSRFSTLLWNGAWSSVRLLEWCAEPF